jgi:hypothetical protein
MKTTTFFELIENFDFNGVSFVSIKGYCSDKSGNSEVADVLINVGASYGNMKKSDLSTLEAANVNMLVSENFGKALIEQALAEKIKSIISPSETRSNGQKEAYINLNANGTLKYCKETKSVIISGVVVKKTIIQAGEYKEVKSRPLTLAKKHLDKVLDLKLAKIRYYKISNITANVKVSGNTIEIE